MITAIKNYFLNEREEELGDLASNLMLNFIIEELAPEFYNKGVYDSYKYISERAEDLLSIQKYWISSITFSKAIRNNINLLSFLHNIINEPLSNFFTFIYSF